MGALGISCAKRAVRDPAEGDEAVFKKRRGGCGGRWDGWEWEL